MVVLNEHDQEIFRHHANNVSRAVKHRVLAEGLLKDIHKVLYADDTFNGKHERCHDLESSGLSLRLRHVVAQQRQVL